MPLDAQMKWVLDQLAAAKTTPFHQMTPDAARRQWRAAWSKRSRCHRSPPRIA